MAICPQFQQLRFFSFSNHNSCTKFYFLSTAVTNNHIAYRPRSSTSCVERAQLSIPTSISGVMFSLGIHGGFYWAHAYYFYYFMYKDRFLGNCVKYLLAGSSDIPEGRGLLKQSVIDEIARISLEISKQIAVATGVPKTKVVKGKVSKQLNCCGRCISL